MTQIHRELEPELWAFSIIGECQTSDLRLSPEIHQQTDLDNTGSEVVQELASWAGSKQRTAFNSMMIN
jgi:hypothetical protein